MSITVQKCTIGIQENELHQILKAVQIAKDKTKMTDDPMPTSDMNIKTWIAERRKRGIIRVANSSRKIN